ncbi:membrane protein [Spirochaetia bacterium]|nr:membrane protein [Spirochaetia bacterium]
MSMMPMGEGIGVQLTKTTKLGLVMLVCFLIGVIITIAEPDLQILAVQVPSVPPLQLILAVAVGVGLFLALAIFRILFKVPLSVLLLIFYGILFAVAILVPQIPRYSALANFIPVAFDSGGVTTGPMTVPFILAMGIGVASVRSDKNSQDDSFGLVALCSIGPILAVLFLGIFFNPKGTDVSLSAIPEINTSRDVIKHFALEFPRYTEDVFLALAAIVVFFFIFQGVSRRYKRHQIGRILIGFLYTFIGLVVFLTGVNVGFIPVGHLLGEQVASSSYKWILVPLSILIGYFIVAAEPAVHVLNKQVEEISQGTIPRQAMKQGLSIGMAAALGITMVRILVGIPIMYILIPGYALALILTFFIPRIFTGIAFDSGGVCSGPMTSTFLLPLAMGACRGVGGDQMADAFGIVAMVAMTPLIVIQIMGLVYGFKIKKAAKQAAADAGALALDTTGAGEIVEYGVEESSNGYL